MSFLRSSMDNALEKARSTKGPLERLNETSKFYEFAIIQIETHLKHIKEEPDDEIQESSDEKIVANLIELKDLFYGRLSHTNCLIIDKDKKLMKLDPETQSLAHSEPKFQFFEQESTEKVMIKQMNSDMEVFKATLDSPFRQIKKGKLRHFEKQWRLSIEQDTILIIIKGFILDLNMKSPIKSLDYVEKDAIIARLMKERLHSNLQTMAMEEHYMILVNECYNEFWSDNIEADIRDELFVYVLQEVAKDWRVFKENETIQCQLTHEIYKTIFVETISDIRVNSGSEMKKIQNEARVYKKAFLRRFDNLLLAETEVRHHMTDEIYKTIFVETINDVRVNSDLEMKKIQNEAWVYKKAFLRRCDNLLLAETEVRHHMTDEIYKTIFVEKINDIRVNSDLEMKKIQNEARVYKKAFLQRCDNLLLAETEVDLLGDQVEALQDLLQKIYLALDQTSTVFSHNIQVMNILKLIKKECFY